MNKRFLSRLSYCLAMLAVVLAACSRLNLPEPQVPDSTPSAAQLTAARNWFAQTVPATAKPVALNWSNARALAGWLLVPLADTNNPFTAERKHAYRYLVAQSTVKQGITGRIVEVVLEGKVPAADSVARAVVTATKRLLVAPQAPGPLPGLTGILLFYSPAYQYETGFVYAHGVAQNQRVQLLRRRKASSASARSIDNESDCIMELRCGYVNDALSDCIYVPHCVGGSDGGGGGGWSGDGGGGGGGGGGSTPSPTPINTLSIDKSHLKPCTSEILSILENLSGNPLLTNLQKLASTTSGYNWTLKDGPLSGTNQTAFTSSGYDISTNSAITTIDSQKFPNATDLSFARTMLHESFHAYLVVYFQNDRVLANAEYAALVDAYQIQHQDINNIHHFELTFWVNNLADALQQYGQSKGYALPTQFYQDMSWAGLESTQAYKSLPGNTKQRIQNTIQTELTGTNSAGNSTIQNGKRPGC